MMTSLLEYVCLAVTEPLPMKRELKVWARYAMQSCRICNRTTPYEEGTESVHKAIGQPIHCMVTEPLPMKRELKVDYYNYMRDRGCCNRTTPYEEGTESNSVEDLTAHKRGNRTTPYEEGTESHR